MGLGSATIGTVKTEAKSLMVWVMMTANRVYPPYFFDGRVTGKQVKAVLKRRLLRQKNPNGRFIFQQDNASVHTSNVVRQYLHQNNVRCLTWPAQSPDLSPIENLFGLVKGRLRSVINPPRNIPELKKYLTKQFLSVPKTTLAKMVASMPNRCALVKKSAGFGIRY